MRLWSGPLQEEEDSPPTEQLQPQNDMAIIPAADSPAEYIRKLYTGECLSAPVRSPMPPPAPSLHLPPPAPSPATDVLAIAQIYSGTVSSSDAVVPSSSPAASRAITWTSVDQTPHKIFRMVAGSTYPEAELLVAGPAGSFVFNIGWTMACGVCL